jgi:hypothetical protein
MDPVLEPHVPQPALHAEPDLAIDGLGPLVVGVGVQPQALHAQLAEGEVHDRVDRIRPEAASPLRRIADGDPEGARAVGPVDEEDVGAPDRRVVFEAADHEAIDGVAVLPHRGFVALAAEGEAGRRVAHQLAHPVVGVPGRDEVGIVRLEGPKVDVLAAQAADGSVGHGGQPSDLRAARAVARR